MKWLVLVLLFAILPSVSALNVELFNSQSEQITNSHFRIITPNYKTLLFVENNSLEFPLEEGPVLLIADDLRTLGADHIFEIQDPNHQGKIYMLPAGTVRVKVYNSEGLIVPKANVQISCGTVSYSDIKTDKFGGVEKAVPAGQCEVTASRRDTQGNLLVNVTQGEIVTDLQLVLDEGVLETESIITFVLVIILAGIVVAWYMTRKKNSSDELKTEKSEFSGRSKDIIETLNEKEKKITEFLSSGESYQNKVGRELQIPKTTLVRLLSSLEKKKVISVEKIGKTKKIKLSSWFLGEKD